MMIHLNTLKDNMKLDTEKIDLSTKARIGNILHNYQ